MCIWWLVNVGKKHPLMYGLGTHTMYDDNLQVLDILGNHDARHDSPSSCRDALSKKCQRINTTRQNKKRSYKKKLEISGKQDVRSKHEQNWINHLERMDNTGHPTHALNYKPRRRRYHGCPRKRWQHFDAGTGQTT